MTTPKLLPTMSHKELRLVDPNHQPADGELCYRVDARFKHRPQHVGVELVRVIHKPTYSHKEDEIHWTLQVLGTPAFFDGALKVPELPAKENISEPSSYWYQVLVRRTPEVDLMVRVWLVMRSQLRDERTACKALRNAIASIGNTK